MSDLNDNNDTSNNNNIDFGPNNDILNNIRMTDTQIYSLQCYFIEIHAELWNSKQKSLHFKKFTFK
jgi:hypothetical protein